MRFRYRNTRIQVLLLRANDLGFRASNFGAAVAEVLIGAPAILRSGLGTTRPKRRLLERSGAPLSALRK